jgi:hypothetical protein
VTKRLQVLLDEDELSEIRRAARRKRLSVAEWVRTALREARVSEGGRPPRDKLRAVRSAMGHAFPTGSVEEMNADIARGHVDPHPS